jgi:ABC-type branched-subunit amino acid transport system substrate-binding protein
MVHPLKSLAFGLALLSMLMSALLGQSSLQYSEAAEKLFTQGVALFSAERFKEAGDAFDTVIKEFPQSQRTTAAYLMKAKSLLQLNDEPAAVRVLTTFLTAFPTSSYIPDAYYTLGLVQVRLHLYDDAMQSFLTAWRGADPFATHGKLTADIQLAMEGLIDGQLSAESVRRLLADSRSDEERAFFWLKLGEKEIARGNVTAASTALDTLSSRYLSSHYAQRIASLRARIEQRSSVKLGALLPLMRRSEPSPMKEIGTEVYEGVQFAIEEYQKDPTAKVKVTLDVIDTERDPLLASRGVQDLTNDNDIIGIIGPVFSSTTSAAVGVANARGVPLVTPTANANGIAAVGPYIFQANPDYEARGKAMARYAVEVHGLKTLAVLAPSDTYGRFMAEAFVNEATRLHAHVVATEWYQRGTSDLKMQLSNIRRIGMMEAAEPLLSFAGKLNRSDLAKLIVLGVPAKTIDSLIEKGSDVGAISLLGPDARGKIDSLGITAHYPEPKVDSLEYPVLSIHGIYVPISSPEEVGIIASQIVYFNFQTQLLGSGEWNSFAELDANKRYCNGVIFESDNFIDPKDAGYGEFLNRFFERYKKRPSKNTLYGYDTAKLVLALIRGGVSTREGLRRALGEVREYQGFHSRMGFSSYRVNPWLFILQYSPDRIQRVDEINVEKQ